MQTTAFHAAHFSERLKTWFVLVNAWRALMAGQRNVYHPEKHYMRGPGPKCREKHATLCGTVEW